MIKQNLVFLLVLPLALAAQTTVPAVIDITGEWGNRFHEDQPERIPGPDIGDYLGIPLNDAARLRADSWDASLLTMPEHQCKPHPSDYGSRGPADMRIWKEINLATQQLIAYHTHISWQAPERTIYMDGRPHPPEYAPHTWQGFSTGKWEGNILKVTTTHLKTGWIRRNGIPRSEKAVLTEYWSRHGRYLTLTGVIDDPTWLTESFVRSTNWELSPDQQIAPYPCEAVVEIERPKGQVPHHLPGQNTFLKEFPAAAGVPEQAARGGSETMYPEYRDKLKSMPVLPKPVRPAKPAAR